MDLVLLKWNNNNNKICQEESRLQQATELGNKVVYVLIYKVRAPRSVDAEESSLHKEMLSGSLWLMLLSSLKLIVDFFFFVTLVLCKQHSHPCSIKLLFYTTVASRFVFCCCCCYCYLFVCFVIGLKDTVISEVKVFWILQSWRHLK